MKFYNDQKSLTGKMALSKEIHVNYKQEIEQSEKLNNKSKKKIKWKEMLLMTVMMK